METRLGRRYDTFFGFEVGISLNYHCVRFKFDICLNHSYHFYHLQGSLAILRLLLSQAKQVRETPPEERMNSVYLQDINLERNKGHIRDNDMVDIQAVRQKRLCLF